jgi:hypothetical protein
MTRDQANVRMEVVEFRWSATLRRMTKTTQQTPPKTKDPEAYEHDDCHPAFRLFPPGRPLAECQPLNHPRGCDGGWGR